MFMTFMNEEVTLVSCIGERVVFQVRCTLSMDFVYDCVFLMRFICPRQIL